MAHTGNRGKRKIRSATVAGLFYPEDRAEAEAGLCSFGIGTDKGGRASLIIAPHGAWKYSGEAAAAAFSAAYGRVQMEDDGPGIRRVVFLGAIHHSPEEGIFISDSDYYETPLGNIAVDHEICRELASCGTLFEINDIPHLKEHSTEALLPFIKFCFPRASIVPVLMGGSRLPMVKALGTALSVVFQDILESTLFVISSTISISHTSPGALEEAGYFMQLLHGKDGQKIAEEMEARRISPCGGALIAAALESGLFSSRTIRDVSGPPIKVEEDGMVIYYGGVSFE